MSKNYYVSLASAPSNVAGKHGNLALHQEIRIHAAWPKRAAETFILTEFGEAIKYKSGTFVVEVRTPTTPSVIRKFDIITQVVAVRNRRK